MTHPFRDLDDDYDRRGGGVLFAVCCALAIILVFLLGFCDSPHAPLKPLPTTATTRGNK